MLPAEAKVIGNLLARLPLDEVSPCLNLGSSTAEFRTVRQRHINEDLTAPNELRGVRFIHADMKNEPGVDVAGDIFDPEYRARLAAMRPASLLCCNMFEHVVDRTTLAKICRQIVRPGGYVIVSVPYSFPYHIDPIDTYFRPDPAELALLFPDSEIVNAEVVVDGTYWEELKQQTVAQRLLTILKLIVHLPLPFIRWEVWKCKMHRLFWLFRPYRVSVILMRCGQEAALT
jgi:SAM-dependent methyltransferase